MKARKPRAVNQAAIWRAFEIAGQALIAAAGEDDDRGAVGVAVLRLEDGEGGDVVAGFAFGLGGVTGPEADGLDAEEVVVVVGDGTRVWLCLDGGTGEQTRGRKDDKTVHSRPPRHCGGL